MFGLQPWDIEIGSNFKNMADVMSRDNRILYVNRPLDRITKWRMRNDIKTKNRLNSISKSESHLQQVQKNLWVLNPRLILESINFLPPGFLYRHFNKKNSQKIANEINKVAKELGFGKDVLMIDNDFFNGLYLKEMLKPRFTLYYLRDYLRSQQYFQKHGAESEPAMIKKADAVASNSLYLNSYAQSMNSKSYYVGQGCEVESFIKKPEVVPADMEGYTKPVIGYCGMLTSRRLDINLLVHLANAMPDFEIVLVGKEDQEFQLSELHKITNVHFHGAKEPGELPGYVHRFDVCINPQLVNQMTIGNYPRKIDEYLAAGKPTVATSTEAMMAFKDVVYLCKTYDDYVNNIRLAYEERLDKAKTEQRIKEASQHTWEDSVARIYDILKQHML